ncbi:MAG: hypothetical protein GY765_10720 [bacterium]|nr:hypothetical protein [bacterium]
MKRLPGSIQTFPDLLESNYLYGDNTGDGHQLFSIRGLKLLGIGFNVEQRNLNDYLLEELK